MLAQKGVLALAGVVILAGVLVPEWVLVLEGVLVLAGVVLSWSKAFGSVLRSFPVFFLLLACRHPGTHPAD